MASFNCIEKPLRRFYARYGRFISRHPLVFLILPIFLAAGLGTGIMFLEKESDTEYLFTPKNGRAKDEQKTIEALFNKHSQDNQLVSRLTSFGNYGRAIIVAKDEMNILEEEIFGEVVRLNREILKIAVSNENNIEYDYNDICLKWQHECIANDVLEVFNFSGINSMNENQNPVTYPYWASAEQDRVYFLGSGIGGEILESNTSIIIGAAAIKLEYYLKDDIDNDGLSAIWEDEFVKLLEKFHSETVEVTRYTSQSLQQELNKASEEVFGTFTIAFTLIINFSIWSCTKLDWVQNKPWLACLGVLSAGFAILSTFGILGFCGVPFIDIVASTPILILSIGVDDMFIMICAWRRTDVFSTVEDRMAETLSEAALSITITSLTDALAFGIGTITFFPSVQIFCIFTGVAVLFDYFYQVTFFAAAMVLTGRREDANRHCVSCNVVRPFDEAPSIAYKIFCAGGPSHNHPEYHVQDSSHAVMLFFRDYFAPFVCHPIVKILTIVFYMVYLGFSILGVTRLQEGLELRNIASDKSYVVPFYDYENRFFKRYGPAVAVVFNDEHEYWKPAVQEELDDLVARFEGSRFTHGDTFTTWWLQDYLDYLDVIGNNDPSKEDFFRILIEEFLQFDIYKQYSLDIIFNEEANSIKTSRFYVLTRDITNSTRETAMMNDMRKLADDADENITVFHPSFIFIDQYEAVLPNTVQNLCIALGSMLLVSLLLIPKPICAIWVALSIASIEVGVVGLMSFWGVKLNSVSMINIILCVGFSVDFSAHMAYAFSIADGSTNDERARAAFYALGMPIAQGACSTVLGILVLISSDIYIFRTFFKTIFLVITLGVVHSLFILPVVLMLFSQTPCSSSDSIPQVVPINCRPLRADVLRTDGLSPNLSQRNEMEMNSKEEINELLVIGNAGESTTKRSLDEGRLNPAFKTE